VSQPSRLSLDGKETHPKWAPLNLRERSTTSSGSSTVPSLGDGRASHEREHEMDDGTPLIYPSRGGTRRRVERCGGTGGVGPELREPLYPVPQVRPEIPDFVNQRRQDLEDAPAALLLHIHARAVHVRRPRQARWWLRRMHHGAARVRGRRVLE
jgi:hypothetical protein